MGLHLEVLPGESIVIGSGTRITVEDKSGKKVRLRIDSTDSVRLNKAGEAHQRIPAEDGTVLRRPMMKLPQPR